MHLYVQAAKALLKKMIKSFIKQKAGEAAQDKNLVMALVLVVILLASTPILIFTGWGDLGFSSKDDSATETEEDPDAIITQFGGNAVISWDTYKDVTKRIEKLRIDTNSSVDKPGENYGKYTLNDPVDGKDSSETSGDDQPKDDMVQEAVTSTSAYPHADHNIWVTGDKENVNEGLLRRLAAIGEHYGKTVNILSGQRPYLEQKELYEGYLAGKPGYNLAANPMYGTHVMGLAVDVTGWLKTDISSSALAPWGLAKEVPGENWHIQGKGIINIPREQRMHYDYDGYKVPQGLIDAMFNAEGQTPPQVGSSDPITTADANGVYSEAFIHLIALNHTDQLNMGRSTKKYLEQQEEDGTNMGKTWTLAKALKPLVKDGSYPDDDVVKRAKDEKWGNSEYLDLARWEIQKCFFLGDEDQGFFGKIFGSPTPCGYIKEITGKDIVPTSVQGVAKQTKTNSDGVETVKYEKVTDLLNAYKEISLFKDNEDFEPTLKDILDTLYTRSAAPTVSYGPTEPGIISAGEEAFNQNFVSSGVDPSWKTIITEIVRRESTFNPQAKNPTSTAYGYAQFLASTREQYEKKTGLSYDDPVNQIIMMAMYIEERYKTPEAALAFWDANHWY